MSDINEVIISGNLTRDPIARGGGTVAAFSVASNRQRQVDGAWIEETTYVDCSAFGHNARKAIEKLLRGMPVTVTGRLELNSYTNQDGEKRSQLRVVVSTLHSPCFTAKMRRAWLADSTEELPTSANVETEPSEAKDLVASNGQPVEDDDIPF